jgi:hypothetical protein
LGVTAAARSATGLGWEPQTEQASRDGHNGLLRTPMGHGYAMGTYIHIYIYICFRLAQTNAQVMFCPLKSSCSLNSVCLPLGFLAQVLGLLWPTLCAHCGGHSSFLKVVVVFLGASVYGCGLLRCCWFSSTSGPWLFLTWQADICCCS